MGRHRTHDASNAMVAFVIELAVRHFTDLVQELPDIALFPIDNGRHKDRVLAADAADLLLLVVGELVLIEVLVLLANLLLLPLCELLEVTGELPVGYFHFLSLGPAD